MKYVFLVEYDQKFGKDWHNFSSNTVAKDGEDAVRKVKNACFNEELDGRVCSGFRLIRVERGQDVQY